MTARHKVATHKFQSFVLWLFRRFSRRDLVSRGIAAVLMSLLIWAVVFVLTLHRKLLQPAYPWLYISLPIVGDTSRMVAFPVAALILSWPWALAGLLSRSRTETAQCLQRLLEADCLTIESGKAGTPPSAEFYKGLVECIHSSSSSDAFWLSPTGFLICADHHAAELKRRYPTGESGPGQGVWLAIDAAESLRDALLTFRGVVTIFLPDLDDPDVRSSLRLRARMIGAEDDYLARLVKSAARTVKKLAKDRRSMSPTRATTIRKLPFLPTRRTILVDGDLYSQQMPSRSIGIEQPWDLRRGRPGGVESQVVAKAFLALSALLQ